MLEPRGPHHWVRGDSGLRQGGAAGCGTTRVILVRCGLQRRHAGLGHGGMWALARWAAHRAWLQPRVSRVEATVERRS